MVTEIGETYQTLRYPSSDAETRTLVELSSAKQTPFTVEGSARFVYASSD